MIEKNSKIVSVYVNNNKIMRYRYRAAFSTQELELYASAVDNFDGFIIMVLVDTSGTQQHFPMQGIAT